MPLRDRVTAARSDLRDLVAGLDEVDVALLGAPGSSAEVPPGKTVAFLPPPALAPRESRGIRREYRVEQPIVIVRQIGGRLASDVEAASEACALAALAVCDAREDAITLEGAVTLYDPPVFEAGQAMQIPAQTGEWYAAHPGTLVLSLVDTPTRMA